MAEPGKTISRGDWARAVEQPSFKLLIGAKRRLVGPMLAIFLVSFFWVMGLAGYARPLLAEKVGRSMNLGFLLIVGLYCLCWVLAVLYVTIANRSFDAKVAAIEDNLARGRRAS